MAYNYLLSLQSYFDEVKINLNRLRYTRVHQNALRRRSTVNNLFSVTRQDREREKNTTHHRFSSDKKYYSPYLFPEPFNIFSMMVLSLFFFEKLNTKTAG